MNEEQFNVLMNKLDTLTKIYAYNQIVSIYLT